MDNLGLKLKIKTINFWDIGSCLIPFSSPNRDRDTMVEMTIFIYYVMNGRNEKLLEV